MLVHSSGAADHVRTLGLAVSLVGESSFCALSTTFIPVAQIDFEEQRGEI